MPGVPFLKFSFENAISPLSPGKAASAEPAARASMIADNNNATPKAPRTPRMLVLPTLSPFREGDNEQAKTP
jgi:hypothetical protein